MILFSWIRIPRVRSETRHLVSLGGLSQIPSGYAPLRVQRRRCGSQFPLLRWDDDDRWETVSNVDVCMKTCVKQTPWKRVDSGSSKFGKITCDMVVQFDCLGFMVNSYLLHRCHCPMMIKDGVKETNVSSIIHLWGHPWPINEPSALCTSHQLSCCLDLNWMSWDLSWYLSGPYLDMFGS